jgi:uncharacterized protein
MPIQQNRIPPLIRGLLRPECYSHPIVKIAVEETHISWVVLTGHYAYKIKKPVDFGFLDFSSLEKRRRYCEEELRLNRRLAGDLYIDVVRICGNETSPVVEGSGSVIEYAVRMRQFSDAALASNVAKTGNLAGEQFDDLAVRLARFHQTVGHSNLANERGGSRSVHRAVAENFLVLKERCADPANLAEIIVLESWMNSRFERQAGLMDLRSRKGAVCECHGDLHLGNLVVLDGRLVPFDCIEFSEELRWIDFMSELAFLVMDLECHGLKNLAWRFLNRYLLASGDYEGLPLLTYFLIYRALVRAKIALLSAGTGATDIDDSSQRCVRYLQYAREVTKETVPSLMILHGYSGSGKSVLAGLISEWLPAIWLRSDVERNRLASAGESRESRYAPEQTGRVYQHLKQLAGILLQSGYSVVVDATFLESAYRHQMKLLASSFQAPFVMIDIHCPIETMRLRIEERRRIGIDPSEATTDVLEQQLSRGEPLTTAECADTWVVSGETPFDRQAILSELRARLGRNESGH